MVIDAAAHFGMRKLLACCEHCIAWTGRESLMRSCTAWPPKEQGTSCNASVRGVLRKRMTLDGPQCTS